MDAATPPLPRARLSEPLPESWLGKHRGRVDLHVGLASDPILPDDEVEGLMTMLTVRVDAALLDRFPRLRAVSNMAVGYDNIDLAACRERSILVGNTPGVLTDATADLAMGLVLASARGFRRAAEDAREGRWGPWSPTGWLGLELRGARLGILGLGEIGAAVARRAQAFGMEVVYAGPRPKSAAEDLGITRLPLDALLATSDVVSLHCPLNDDTRGLIGSDALARMKPSAHLVNSARGGIVDTTALLEALAAGTIAGAALDVTDPEPLPPTHALYREPRCLVVPHLGSATERTRAAMAHLALDNLCAALEGRPMPSPVEG